MKLYFNPLDATCKSITGGVREKEELQLNIYAYEEEGEHKQEQTITYSDAFLLLCKDGETEKAYPMQKTDFGWSITFSIDKIGLYYYSFALLDGYLSEGKGLNGVFSYQKGKYYQLLVSTADYSTPEWFKGGTMYQIFPDRFHKKGTMPDITGRVARKWGETPYFRPNENGKVLNNDFFGGNFKGIEEKLGYLADLGVTTVYLNPIFLAASNHRYDTSDYKTIDPMLGTEEDFASLIKTGKKYGISFILDGVFNHTGDDSVYFNKYGRFSSVGAFQSKKSPYFDWYTFKKYPNQYESWWGIDILPSVNENSQSYQDFLFEKGGVLDKWLGFGIGGYRLDVADELPDFFLKKLRKSVKTSNPNAVIIGEVWEDASNKIAYQVRREYLQGLELDSVMNYPLKNAIISYLNTGKAEILSETIRILVDHYPKETLDSLMNILGTHDTARVLTVLGGNTCKTKEEMANPSNKLSDFERQNAIKKLEKGAVLQFFLPGVPCVYYGDENGQEGYIDPFCRGCFDWSHIDPLQEHYKKLGNIRKTYQNVLKDGKFDEIYAGRGLFAFQRENEFGCIYCFVNNSSEKFLWKSDVPMKNLWTNEIIQNNFSIDGNSFGIYVRMENAKK